MWQQVQFVSDGCFSFATSVNILFCARTGVAFPSCFFFFLLSGFSLVCCLKRVRFFFSGGGASSNLCCGCCCSWVGSSHAPRIILDRCCYLCSVSKPIILTQFYVNAVVSWHRMSFAVAKGGNWKGNVWFRGSSVGSGMIVETLKYFLLFK